MAATETKGTDLPESGEKKGKEPVQGMAPVGYVRGGGAVRTTEYDAQLEAQFWDAERRRNEALVEKELSKIPIDEGGAKLYTNNLAEQGSALLPPGKVELCWVNSRGEQLYDRGLPIVGVADVNTVDEPAFPGELLLMFFCVECVRRGRHAQDCVIRVYQSNRMWHLSEKTKGERFVDQDGEWHTSAGMIMDSERLTCSVCSSAYRIDKNKVWPG